MDSTDILYHYVVAPVMLISLFTFIVLAAMWVRNDLR